jgi:hypothetical protein
MEPDEPGTDFDLDFNLYLGTMLTGQGKGGLPAHDPSQFGYPNMGGMGQPLDDNQDMVPALDAGVYGGPSPSGFGQIDPWHQPQSFGNEPGYTDNIG